MEDKNQETTTLKLIESAKSVIVILPPDPGRDILIAGISLHLALKESGKISQIGCGSDVHIDQKIEGVNEIADTIGSRNLIISFDYSEENLDKVDYDVRDDGKFYLLVKPKVGAPVPDISGVKYSFSGAEADLVITLGVNSLEELGKIYADEKKFLDNVTTISLNVSLRPVSFTGNVYHKNRTSFCELVTGLCEELKLKINSGISQNLLTFIFESSNNFSSSHLTADTFSSIAYLMRSGARLSSKPVHTPHFSQAPFFEVPDAPTEENIPLPEEEDAPVPSDWNKPKIFRVGDNPQDF
ncbi:MAG TPA: hypothetical protein VLH94_00720 [Spirochaetia bacterium]|nr:hypothetical protein [Spirochaetia bacterium]